MSVLNKEKSKKPSCFGALEFLYNYKLDCFLCPYREECEKMLEQRKRKKGESK